MDYYSSVPNVRESQFDDAKNGLFIINDIRLYVPPTAISVHKEGLEYSFKSLRTRVSTKIASGNGILHAQVKLTFPKEGILQLHRLICQIRNNPFVTVENRFLADSMNDIYSDTMNKEANRRLCTFTVMGLQVANHPSSPEAFVCELDLRKFNPSPYTKVFGFKLDYLTEEYDSEKSRFYAHKVFADSTGSYGNGKVLVREEGKNSNKTARTLVDRFVGKDLSPLDNKQYVLTAKESKAYKRYCNYLQIKALYEDFEIYISDKASEEEKENDKTYVIKISSSLREKLEKGERSILGLHEVGLGNSFDKELLALRDKIIEAMFKNSQMISFGFKEFKKLNGNSGFLNRFDSSLNYGTKGLNKEDRRKRRSENYDAIIKAIKSLNPGKPTQQVNPAAKSEKATFLQVDRKERDINSAKNFKEYGSNFNYHPLVTDAVYGDNGEVQSLSKNKSGKGYDKVSIIFAPFDCTINFQSLPRVLFLQGKDIQITLTSNNFRVPPELINLYKNEYAAKIKKGDIIGFLEGDGKLKVVSNSPNAYDLLKYFYTNNKDEKAAFTQGKSRVVGTPFIFDILLEDIEQIRENDEEMEREGWSYNYSRPGDSIVVEKIVSEVFDIVPLGEKSAKEIKPYNITGCSGVLRNLVSSIPILGLEAPTHQFLGSVEPSYNFSVLGTDQNGGVSAGIRFLEYIRNKSIFNAKNFNFIPDSHNISVDCFLTRLFGSQKATDSIIRETDNKDIELKIKNNFSINSMDTFTIEGSPGVSGLNFRVSESKSFYDEEMAEVRTNEINVNPTDQIVRQLAIGTNLNSSGIKLKTNSYISKSAAVKANYSYLAWETTNFTAKQWYSKATTAGKRAKNKVDPAVDKRAFLWCRDFLEPLLELIKRQNTENRFGPNPIIKFKDGGTFDDAVHDRGTQSNHFANVASDIYVPGMNAKELSAIITWGISQGKFNLSSLRKSNFFTKNSTSQERKELQLNIGMGIYGSEVYGDSPLDFDKKMKDKDPTGGFVHVDANFYVNATNKFKPKTLKAGIGKRRWVGEKRSAAFRTLNYPNNRKQSLLEYWYSDIYEIINALNFGAVEEDSLEEDEINDTVNDDQESGEDPGNKQENIKNTYTLTKREDVLEMLKVRDVFKDLNHSVEIDEIAVKGYSELSEEDQKRYEKYKNKEDYQFIVIEDENIASALKNDKKFNKVKEYLNTNYNLNIQKQKDLISGYDPNDKDADYTQITIPLSTQNRSYNLQQAERQKELVRVSGMLNNFQKLASVILTEPYLYTDDDDEAVAELDRIEKVLSGLQVAPSMYSLGTSLLVGTGAGGKEKIGDQVKNALESEEFLGNALATGVIGGEVLYFAITALIKVGSAAIGMTTIGLSAIGWPLFLIGAGVWGLVEIFSNWGEQTKSLELQQERVRYEWQGYSKIIDEKRLTKYHEALKARVSVFNKDTGVDLSEEDAEDLKSELETVGKYLANATSVGTGVLGYISMVYSSNSIIKYFAEVSKDLKANSTVNQLLRFSEAELKNKAELTDAQKIKGVSLISDELGDYLVRMFAFPYYKDETLIGQFSVDQDSWLVTRGFNNVSDVLDPDDSLFSEIFWHMRSNNDKTLHVIAGRDDYNDLKYEDGSNIDQKEFLIKYQSYLSNLGDEQRKPGTFSDNYFKNRKDSLRANQNKKLAWLKALLDEITNEYVNLSQDPSSRAIKDARDVFKLFENDAYPDIDRPIDPSSVDIKRLLNPAFYYWDSKDLSETVIQNINKETSKSIKAIVDSSTQFQKDLNQGVVSIKSGDALDNIDLKDYKLLRDSTFANSITPKQLNEEIEQGEINLQIQIDSLGEENQLALKQAQELNNIIGSQRADEREAEKDKQIIEDSSDDLIKLGEESYKSFYRENDMLQAFPTFRLYIIEEDAITSEKLLVFDDFYYYNSVIGFQYHESREQSASTATIQLQNISGTLDGSKRLVKRDIDLDATAKEQDLKSAVKDIDSIVIRNGINVQLRAGYENNTSELDVLLSGLITDVQYSNDNTVCSIVVQSHGVELERSIKGFLAKNNQQVYKNGTAELLTNMILSEELKHFGRIKKGRIFPPGQSTDQFFIENFEGRQDNYYAFSLYKTSLTKIEKFAKYAGYALSATVLLRVGRYVFRAPINKVLTSNVGVATTTYLSRVTEVTSGVFRSNFATRFLVNSYTAVRNTVNGILSGSVTRVKYGFANYARLALTEPTRELGNRFFRNALIASVGNSRYAAYRALGHGRIGSVLRATTSRILGRDAAAIINRVASSELVALQQAYLVKELGYNAALSIIGSSLAPTTIGGMISGLINPAGIVGKAAGLTAATMLAVLPAALVGGIYDAINYLFLDYRDDLYKLRRRLILSPSDDNIFPPMLKSYYTKEEEDAWYTELLYVGTNIFDGAIGYTSLFEEGTFSLRNYKFRELLESEVLKSNKMIRGEEIDYLVENQTFWQILHEMSLRHPGYCYAARPYGQGLEYRVFFGLPNYKHYIKPASNYDAMRLNKIYPAIEDGRPLTLKEIEELYFGEYKELKSQKKTDEQIKKIISQIAYQEYKKKNAERFVPFRNYHLVDSSETLISNNIVCSSHNCTNKVIVNFSFKGDRGSQEAISSSGTHDSIYTLPLKASKNIPPELERPKVVSSPNINGIGAANRYGLSSLMYGMKNMYEGSLLTLGNPKVRPWDIVMLKDRITNMYGPLEVKAVTHTFNHEVGFLTDIEVNAVVSANDFSSIPMIDQSIIYEARKEIFDEFNSRASFGLTGDEQKDKALLKKRLAHALSRRLEEIDPESEFNLSSLLPSLGTNAARSFAGGTIESFFKDRNIDPDKIDDYLDGLTNKLYEVYNNPENRNFYNDVLSQGQVPVELTDELGNLLGLIGGGITATGLVGIGANKILNSATGAMYRGGYRSAGALAAIGLTVALGSRSETVRDAVNGISSYYYNRYLKENVIRPQILAKSTEQSLIKILPLIKDGKPLVAGGIEGVSQDEQWNRVLTNIYNNISDATEGYMEQKEKLQAAGANVIKRASYGDYSFAKRYGVSIADTTFKLLLGEEAGGVAIGYAFGEEGEGE